MHPEVTSVSLLISLYAWKVFSIITISNLKSLFNYSVIWFFHYNKVTKLNLDWQAGNNYFNVIGTSETIRENIDKTFVTKEKSSKWLYFATDPFYNEKIKLISEHVPRHTKPISDEAFGHYLAGLIDGDGWFSKYAAHIVFNGLDVSLAYYIKNRIGYGTVTKVKSKNAVILTITKREGIQKTINLINGKLRTQSKFDAIYKYILNVYIEPLYLKEKFHLNTTSDLNNHWLAGFLDADGSFQIKTIIRDILNGGTRFEILLNMQIDQKTRLLLDLIKNKLGGNIGYRKSQDTYYYSSTSFCSAKRVIEYLDKYHMLSSKHINYLKWRKVYLLVQTKKHLTPEGQNRIHKLKSSMNSYSRETLEL